MMSEHSEPAAESSSDEAAPAPSGGSETASPVPAEQATPPAPVEVPIEAEAAPATTPPDPAVPPGSEASPEPELAPQPQPEAEAPAEPAVPQVILRPRMARPFFARHPWVFASAIARVNGNPADGDLVELFSHQGQFIARGLFNSHSRIRVRLYTWDHAQELDEAFWSQKLDQAIALRQQVLPDQTNRSACRMVSSEGDGLSGLTVDRFGEWLLVQITSLALSDRRELLFDLLEQKLKPQGIWLRTEKGIRELEGLEAHDGLVRGKEPPRPLFVEEDGLQFGVDVIEGQKTGFYLDQRENRRAAVRYFQGSRVLDCCCYSGAFGIALAVQGGAKHVLGVDVSQPALALATANAELNGAGERFSTRQGRADEVMDALKEAGETFDMVVLDPPKMARHRSSVQRAQKGYYRLNRRAVDLLSPGGILVTCSCSGLVGREEFAGVLASVAEDSGRTLQILEVRGAAADHPVALACPESSYLKCFIVRVL